MPSILAKIAEFSIPNSNAIILKKQNFFSIVSSISANDIKF